MADREKVIKALEYCGSGQREFNGCNGCPYKDEFHSTIEGCLWCRIDDAIALLKEQEARKKNRLPCSPDSNVQWT